MGLRTMMLFAETLGVVEDVRTQNEEQIEKAREMYWDACKYPRKKKKAIRKQAKKDFIFWSELNEIYNRIF